MAELDHMIAETRKWRVTHAIAARNGHPARHVDAAACAIRERALLEAKSAIIAEKTGRKPSLKELGWSVSALQSGDR